VICLTCGKLCGLLAGLAGKNFVFPSCQLWLLSAKQVKSLFINGKFKRNSARRALARLDAFAVPFLRFPQSPMNAT